MHRIRIEHERDVVVLAAEGEFDAYNAQSLSDSLAEAGLRGDGRYVVDLSRVAFMDSTALGLLVRTTREVGERGAQVRIVLPDTTARRIFEITTLDRVLPIASSRAAAIAELTDVEDVRGAAATEP